MTDLARVALLDLRTVAPYRRQIVLTPLLVVAIMFNRPEVVVPGLTLLCASTTAGYPFLVSDRADLETLYAVLPLTRRSLLLGHYAWALAVFAVTAGLGTPVALILASQQHIAFAGPAVAIVVALSWAAFALSVSIQFPLFVRFGYTKTGMLATTLPISVVAVGVNRLHVHFTPNATLPALLAAAGAALLAVSLAASTAVDPRRMGTAAV
ncbi:MAG: ABC-2 transporter permease [Actinocrinis sp.]